MKSLNVLQGRHKNDIYLSTDDFFEEVNGALSFTEQIKSNLEILNTIDFNDFVTYEYLENYATKNDLDNYIKINQSIEQTFTNGVPKLASTRSISDDYHIIDKKYVDDSITVVANKQRRNYLINGNFDMWQRDTSQTLSGYGSDDRWLNANAGSTKTHSQQLCTDTERALFNATYYSRTVVNSVSGSDNCVVKLQRIENVTLLAGKTVTWSFWARADSNKPIAVEFVQGFGTGGSPSSPVESIGVKKFNLTTNWQRYTHTVTLPNIVGKTLGTDGIHTTFTQLAFWFDAGSNFNYRTDNLGQQSGTFDLAQIKLEDGSQATDGWHPYDGEFGGELTACLRYYETHPFQFYAGYIYTGVMFTNYHSYKVIKRTTPTIIATEISNIGFPAGAPFVTTISEFGFQSYKIANLTGTGSYSFSYTANAEL